MYCALGYWHGSFSRVMAGMAFHLDEAAASGYQATLPQPALRSRAIRGTGATAVAGGMHKHQHGVLRCPT